MSASPNNSSWLQGRDGDRPSPCCSQVTALAPVRRPRGMPRSQCRTPGSATSAIPEFALVSPRARIWVLTQWLLHSKVPRKDVPNWLEMSISASWEWGDSSREHSGERVGSESLVDPWEKWRYVNYQRIHIIGMLNELKESTDRQLSKSGKQCI